MRLASFSYPVHKVDSSDCADLGRVVDEADVSLCGSVQLSNFNVSKAMKKLGPNVRSDTVADCNSHFVVLLIIFLPRAGWTRRYSTIRTAAD